MWCLRYSKVQPEVICDDPVTVDDRQLLNNVGRRLGNIAEQLAT
jgi:hypothetical protein